MAFIVLQAALLHASFRILKHRGRLMLSVVSLLFVNAFFQIIDRPVDYVYGLGWSSELEITTFVQLASNFEQYVRWPLYAFYVIPFTALIYRADLKTIAKAYALTGVATLAVISPLLLPQFSERDTLNDFNAVLMSDQAIAGEFATRVVPLMTKGDQTGEYRPAIAGLDPLISRLSGEKAKMLALKDRSWGVCAGRLQSVCGEMDQVLELRLQAFENFRALMSAPSADIMNERLKRADEIGARLQAALKRLQDALDTANRLAS